MRNKLLVISLLINSLLVIAILIIIFRSQKPDTTSALIYSTDSSQPNKKIFKRLPFLSNQSNELIKKDTSIILYKLPAPRIESNFSIEEALFKRRSKRAFQQNSLSSTELSQILWSAYGVSRLSVGNKFGNGMKTCPSADSKYPLTIYVLAGNIRGLPSGLYKYYPGGHKLLGISGGDKRETVYEAADRQMMIKEAPLVLVYTAKLDNILPKDQAIYQRWTDMETGHSAQNVYLQATALNLATCAIGWFNENQIKQQLQIPKNEQILYLMPIGQPLKEIE